MHEKLDVVVEDVTCCLGCGKNDQVLFCAHDLLHDLPGIFEVVICRTCGLIRTNPRPTPDTIGYYYPDDYGPYLDSIVTAVEEESSNTIKQFFKPMVKKIFNFHGTPLPTLPVGHMLEIGCASGSYLHNMASKGWQVQGIEFSAKAAQTAMQLGYSVHVGPLESAPQPESPLDLIVGWMVLEHLYDPVAGLRKLSKWAKPEAWLVLSVPNAGALEFRIFKDKWYALQVPTHLNHFTPQSLKKVLLAGGWQIVALHHQRTLSNLIGSFGYVLRQQGLVKLGNRLIEFPHAGGIMTYLLYPLSWLMSLFGQTGRMTVWARKSELSITKER